MRIPTNRALPSALATTAPVSMVLLGITQLLEPLEPLVSAAGMRRGGFCAACGAPVGDRDDCVRYRGEYYHSGPCRDLDPRPIGWRRIIGLSQTMS
jgi:hypothetical protein